MRIRKPKTKEQKAKDNERSKLKYRLNKDNPAFMAKIRKNSINWQINNPERYLWVGARGRAKKNNIPFNISVEDVEIPDVCPILGISLKRGVGKPENGSPTLDRIIPKLGYVKGNIWVISRKANVMKSDATFEELKRFANWALTLN